MELASLGVVEAVGGSPGEVEAVGGEEAGPDPAPQGGQQAGGGGGHLVVPGRKDTQYMGYMRPSG